MVPRTLDNSTRTRANDFKLELLPLSAIIVVVVTAAPVSCFCDSEMVTTAAATTITTVATVAEGRSNDVTSGGGKRFRPLDKNGREMREGGNKDAT